MVAVIKRKNRLALASMRDIAIVWSSEFEGQAVTLYSMTTLRPITPNEYHFYCVQQIQHKWSMNLIVVGIEPSGTKYLKHEMHTLNEPRPHTATIEYFNDEHGRLLKSINPNHDSSAAWIATIDDIELTESQLWQLTGL